MLLYTQNVYVSKGRGATTLLASPLASQKRRRCEQDEKGAALTTRIYYA